MATITCLAIQCPPVLCHTMAVRVLREKRACELFRGARLLLDVTYTRALNASFAGLLAMAARQHLQATGSRPELVLVGAGPEDAVTVALRALHLEQVLRLSCSTGGPAPKGEVWWKPSSAERTRSSPWPLRAFLGELMRLHPENRRRFQRVVALLR